MEAEFIIHPKAVWVPYLLVAIPFIWGVAWLWFKLWQKSRNKSQQKAEKTNRGMYDNYSNNKHY